MPALSRDARRAQRARHARRKEALSAAAPYLAMVRAPAQLQRGQRMGRNLIVATYNVHRWTGRVGARAPDAAGAGQVIAELGADVVALQEVLRPFDAADPLEMLADALHMHLAFVATRVHRRGEIGNAILSRWPITSIFSLDLSFNRVERRSAVAACFQGARGPLSVVATHLALVDRTRRRQVRFILEHPQLQGPVVLLGDMNAWRNCHATRTLDRELVAGEEISWPRSFPAARPVLALDRIYARGAQLRSIQVHRSAAARRASDHLPVVGHLRLGAPAPRPAPQAPAPRAGARRGRGKNA
ncbi:MAG: endonuclease/exonuclease/phosphatase family protein [Deltaproteobacteria bacterium]|nr:endonuclease/exonuclease/phosphatase family protein [Deltaproteobacteria bacterium]